MPVFVWLGMIMQFNLDSNFGKYQINSYQPGVITINKIEYKTSVIITPDQLITNWPPQQLSELSAQHLKKLIELNPQIVILGTGEKHSFISQQMMLPFLQQGIGFEVMNTEAACRTYNVLLAEGRNIVAALLVK